jgi:hypothetical protein
MRMSLAWGFGTFIWPLAFGVSPLLARICSCKDLHAQGVMATGLNITAGSTYARHDCRFTYPILFAQRAVLMRVCRRMYRRKQTSSFGLLQAVCVEATQNVIVLSCCKDGFMC